MNVGMQPDGVAMVGFDLGLAGYEPGTREAFQRRALEAVEQAPGIASAAYGNSLPLSIDISTTTIYPENQPGLEPRQARSAVHYKASPGYFRTIGTTLVAGRDFDWRDTSNTTRVAIVNQTFARNILGVEPAVGQRFAFGQNGPLIEVVGVVENGKYASLSESPRAAVFSPILQWPNTNIVLLARAGTREAETVALLTRTVHELDPRLTLYQTESLRDMLGLALFPSRAAAIALTAFGLLAALLAGTGIYGVVAYAVARRVREIGVRIAMGARPGQVLGLVFVRIAVLMAIGGAIGLLLAMLTARVLASIVYQASPGDPIVIGGVIASVTILGLAASWAPARRALRLNPTTALRAE
jgi:predicted permease